MAAVQRAPAVIPVFIWAPEEEAPWPPGAASRWWLHQSLNRLRESLAARGSRLIIRRGPTRQTLASLIAETGANALFYNRRHEPAVVARDAAIALPGVTIEPFDSALLFHIERPFQVFSAFWRACLNQPPPSPPLGAPRTIAAPDRWPESLSIDDLRLEPTVDWAGGLRSTWQPGEAAATAELDRFIESQLSAYATMRDRPAHRGTSRLSPHLHFGEISPRQVWHAVQQARGAQSPEPIEAYLRELGWREFAYHLLIHFPHSADQPLRPEFARFPWRIDRRLLESWRRGRTGYPLVDAGMRELWATGWMHNRVRMIVASFLVKHLLIPWQEGTAWFWDTLVDADLANNTLGWQWTAGCGADAAPYFRIFNPARQSERFDPAGEYVRRWVPEISGPDYPRPIVDHATARREALEAFEKMRRLAGSAK